MTELTTLRVYQALVRKEQELPPNRKEEAVALVEAMLESQRAVAKRESKQKTELLETEKELHANLKESQMLKQQEIERINEEILDLKEQVDKVKTETEPEI